MKLKRRQLLQLISSGLALGMGRWVDAAPSRWQNWSGNQSHHAHLHYPASTQALAQLLPTLTGTLRVVGGSHSFSPLISGADHIISLERLAGLLAIDSEQKTVRYGAGTRLMMASSQAWEAGFSFINEPDINLQSLAGAIATSTHGTGSTLPSLSGQVAALTLLTSQGETLNLSPADGDLFRAACCHLGALGIVTDITFQHQEAYHLIERTRVMSLRDAMDYCDSNHSRIRNLEFFAFPRGNTAIVKELVISDTPQTHNAPDDDNALLEWACELTMKMPWLIPVVQRALGLFVSDSERGGPAHLVYANNRTVPFNEMEYSVPLNVGMQCMDELCHHYQKQRVAMFFPMEFRYSAADNSLISMFTNQPGVSISVHQYAKMPHQKWFDGIEPIFHRYQGRPHWGKLHSLGYRQLVELYPEYDTFCRLRQQLDPTNRLINPHLQQLFGITA